MASDPSGRMRKHESRGCDYFILLHANMHLAYAELRMHRCLARPLGSSKESPRDVIQHRRQHSNKRSMEGKPVETTHEAVLSFNTFN